MRVQGIKSLVAAVSSVLVVGMTLSVGSQSGNMVAVPMAPAAQPAAARVISTQMPELPSLSVDSRAATSDDLPGILFSTAAASLATSEPPEEAPGEDTTVLTKPSSVPTVTIPAVKKQASGALLSMPIQGRKTSRFGMRFHPVRHIWKLHSGLDLAAPCGTPVGAAAPGTVVRTGWAGGNGIQVKIDHGTMGGHRVVTTYNHLSAIGVVVGQKVETHQGVGRVGTTGFSTGCHLHFEVIADGQFTNPEPWLNGSAVVVDTVGMGTGRPVVPSTTPTSTKPPAPTQPSFTATPTPTPTVT
ncbi:MAG: M23 family metallopeptidase, partial [Arachnia sp.]